MKAVKTVFNLHDTTLHNNFTLISAMYENKLTVNMIDKFLDGTKTATKTIKDIKADNLPF